MNITKALTKGYENKPPPQPRRKQTQFQTRLTQNLSQNPPKSEFLTRQKSSKHVNVGNRVSLDCRHSGVFGVMTRGTIKPRHD